MRRLSVLRMLNTLVAVILMALFLLHGVGNSFGLMGMGMPTSKVLAHVIVALAVIHAVLGIMLTASTFATQREAGATYVGLNSRFWTVRISGLAIAPLVAFHMLTFLQVGEGAYRLREFAELQLVANACLVLAVAIHVITNVRPMLVGLGIGMPRARAVDFALVFAVLLLLMGVAFVVYYLRWSVI